MPQYLGNIPVDARTVLGTVKKKYKVREVKPGHYIHIGLIFQITFILSLLGETAVDCIQLLFNVDGLPLFKSSSSEIWPILFFC